ncbi:MAG: indole-3-glycerol phosphate synthase TrpC [Verrucomicrobiales bacterium]
MNIPSATPDRLAQIIHRKKDEVEALLPRENEFKKKALEREHFRGFAATLRAPEEEPGLRLIAEVKQASPSAGVISDNFDPVGMANFYETGGAHAISVLTDQAFFRGSLDDLIAVRNAVELPVLRKDFTIHPAQIFEAVAAGADAILLIVAALSDDDLSRLLDVAFLCGVDALVEVHNMSELDRALDTEATLIGINNRNLSTFEVDLATTDLLAEQVPDDYTLISESGIWSATDAQRVLAAGVDGILVGESLMRAPDPSAKIGELLGRLY